MHMIEIEFCPNLFIAESTETDLLDNMYFEEEDFSVSIPSILIFVNWPYEWY